MSTFTPPTDDFVPGAIPPRFDDPAETRFAYNLFRHYTPQPRGRNVFRLADGTYTENDPASYADVSKVYYGGHVYSDLTPTEVEELTAAGYGAYIS